MDKIVLDVNLKFVLAQLNLIERGELLSALFEGRYEGTDAAVLNVFCYINDLQQKYALEKRKMRDLSAKSAIARKARSATSELTLELPLNNRKEGDLATAEPALEQSLDKRKEAKENNIINKNNLFFSLDGLKRKEVHTAFIPPTLAEVRAYIEENQLMADADTFINFYESHGWMVGTTPIKSWQATLKLWHARNADKQQKQDVDEAYWKELSGRVSGGENTKAENGHE